MFKVLNTSLIDLNIIIPEVYQDNRGFFFESYREEKINHILERDNITFVQDNHSNSKKNVLRGLHYQFKSPQIKLVRVVKGKILDVVVDLRKSSKTFGNWFAIELSESNKYQLLIPEGFAHGYSTISNEAEVLYKVSKYYNPDDEKCIIWNDKKINIDWKLTKKPIISERDSQGVNFVDADFF